MRGYSHKHIFNSAELSLLALAETCVRAVEDPSEQTIRCHELARAVGKVLGLDHVDGKYGIVEHTWLVLDTFEGSRRRCILDVYCVGRLPMVQLVDVQAVGLLHREQYRPGSPRSDIDVDRLDALVRIMRRAL